jgi:hypothetical protein
MSEAEGAAFLATILAGLACAVAWDAVSGEFMPSPAGLMIGLIVGVIFG